MRYAPYLTKCHFFYFSILFTEKKIQMPNDIFIILFHICNNASSMTQFWQIGGGSGQSIRDYWGLRFLYSGLLIWRPANDWFVIFEIICQRLILKFISTLLRGTVGLHAGNGLPCACVWTICERKRVICEHTAPKDQNYFNRMSRLKYAQ